MFIFVAALTTSAWNITDKTSQLDGARSYHALLQAEGTVANIIDHSERPSLNVDCDKGGLYVDVDWPDFVQKELGETRVTVGWKLDSGEVHRTNWMAGDQLVALKGREAVEMLRLFQSANKLVVQVPDHHGGQDAVFDLHGVADVASAVSTMRCG